MKVNGNVINVDGVWHLMELEVNEPGLMVEDESTAPMVHAT